MNADGSNKLPITDHPAADRFLTWSADGSKIAFASERDGNMEIYTVNADGSEPTRLTNNTDKDGVPDWTSGSVP